MEDWRENYRFLVENSLTKVEDLTDPVEVATQIILELQNFSFISNRPDPIPLLSPSKLLFRRQGSCPDLANLALLACRAHGIAVTFEFTPHYAASSNRHFWNTVINTEGNHIPFNGNCVGSLEGLPYAYNPSYKKRMAKVFRKTYAIQPNALATIIPVQDIPKGFLQEKNIKDVTHEYGPVGNLEYVLYNTISDSIQTAYLNVFNTGSWRTIDWAKKEKNNFVFSNLGVDLVYLPSIYKDGKMVFHPFPTLLDKAGKTHILKPDLKNTFDAVLGRQEEFKTDYIENNPLEIEAGKKYQLYYWDKGWQKFGISEATHKGIIFKNLPENALFLLVSKNYTGFERIFILDPQTKRIRWY